MNRRCARSASICARSIARQRSWSASWSSLNLATDLERQLGRRWRHLLRHKGSDSLVDGRSGHRLAARLAARSSTTVADIPGLLASPARSIPDAELLAASATHRTSLQQGCALARRRRSRQLVTSTVRFKGLQVVLKASQVR